MSSAPSTEAPTARHLTRIALISHLPGQPFIANDDLDLKPGEWVVVRCEEGERIGKLRAFDVPVLRPCNVRPVGNVLRRATPEELQRGEQLAVIEREALNYCRQRAQELGLPIRPVAAVAPLDRDLLLMSFAAEERVDFRELLRDLVRRMRRRVELRQIGVRDQAKAAGGWGPCGRAVCCATFMCRFSSVTIRMAKAQKLSLNPTRISGMCGRLMCCLAHEAEASQPSKGRNPSE
jgi:cell fate regulator YaaT (PSP1 superfamily)